MRLASPSARYRVVGLPRSLLRLDRRRSGVRGFPVPRCARRHLASRRVLLPSRAASTASSRSVRVATDRPPEPFADSRRFAAEIEADARDPHRGVVPVLRPSVDLVASPPRGTPPSFLLSARPLRIRRRNAESSALPCHREGSRSVLVVSHHLDGFLRTGGAGIVAARSRPLGSPCFPSRDPAPGSRKNPVVSDRVPFPTAPTPLEDAPCWQCLLRSPLRPEARRSRGGAPSMPLRGWHRCRARFREVPRFTATSSPSTLGFEVSFRRQVCCRRLPFPATDSSVLPWASVSPFGHRAC